MKIKFKPWLIMLFIIAFGLLLFEIYGNYAMENTKKACGKITGVVMIKGAMYVQFEFKIHGEANRGTYNITLIRNDVSLDSLMNLSCVEVEYSIIDKDFSKITDNRVLKE